MPTTPLDAASIARDPLFIQLYRPAGLVACTIRAVAPVGWIILDGSTIANGQTLYPNLWNEIPASWKSGSSILLPDGRGRTVIGAGTGAGLTARTLGASNIGTETVTLTAGESGTTAHTHTASSGTVSADHSHTYSGTTSGQSADHTHVTNVSDVIRNANTAGLFVQDKATAGYNYGPANIGTTGASVDHSHTFSGTTSGISANHTHAITVNSHAGASAASAHNNMQPSMVLNWIISAN